MAAYFPAGFKRQYKTLHGVILKAMDEAAKQAVEKDGQQAAKLHAKLEAVKQDVALLSKQQWNVDNHRILNEMELRNKISAFAYACDTIVRYISKALES